MSVSVQTAIEKLCDALEALPGPLGPATRTLVREARAAVTPEPAAPKPAATPAKPAKGD